MVLLIPEIRFPIPTPFLEKLVKVIFLSKKQKLAHRVNWRLKLVARHP